jgi:DNA-binding transcriptional MerR regulator
MATLVSIGDFSRMTHLTIKALRFYHDAGILEPRAIDAATGYRRYDVSQVATAQVIKRLRELDMPVGDIRRVVHAPDLETRNRAISEHLERMEQQLAQTRSAVSSLRGLLQAPAPAAHAVTFRSVPAMPAIAISAELALADSFGWAGGAFAELGQAVLAHGLEASGPPGALFYPELFQREQGELTLFVPLTTPVVDADAVASGRVRAIELPAAELAIITHAGDIAELDVTYGELGEVVSRQAIGVDGPIWEFFTVSSVDTPDISAWRTEVGWPVFGVRDPSQATEA